MSRGDFCSKPLCCTRVVTENVSPATVPTARPSSGPCAPVAVAVTGTAIPNPSAVIALARANWGAELRRPLEALAMWGARLLASGRGDDDSRPRWLSNTRPALLRETTADPPVSVGVLAAGQISVDQAVAHGFVTGDLAMVKAVFERTTA